MKIFAFYLPQFHTIPENDEWWGKGFTEWVNIKKAKPLFKKHVLKHPLNNNYYNLLSKETVEWQTSIMNEYKVDGLIYYHYYFNGKLLLEKPAENLLLWKDIRQPFFFCWANHPWIRSWEGKKTVLMPMEYGDQDDWERHFQYLLPFFEDRRYEKRNNKPLLMIFKPDFSEKKEMLEYFDTRCKQEGFDGICTIYTHNKYDKDVQYDDENVVFLRQPDVQVNLTHDRNNKFVYKVINRLKRKIMGGIVIYDGKKMMIDLCKSVKTYRSRNNVINGLWFEWDNTYRHKKRGYIIKPYSKKVFMKYMDLISNEEYLFVNAWNEWCEGMVLEPTQEYGFKYLEWIKEWRDKNHV